MIVIDEHADSRLAETVEIFRLDPSGSRCIYLSLMGKTLPTGFKEKVIASAGSRITDNDAQIYLCSDGDICIVSPVLPAKEGNRFILDIVEQLKIPADDSWVSYNDVAHLLPKLTTTVAQKLQKHRMAENEKRKIAEQQRHERKRQSILNQTTIANIASISTRRANRETPELMIIEDDVFSSKLVENVLQKKFTMTSLKEATYALDTYARIAPDLLFLDINLPDVTGHELLERILAMDPNAYVVMLSGNADQKNITQAMAKGAKGFIAKPFTKEKLFQYLDRCPGITAKLTNSY